MLRSSPSPDRVIRTTISSDLDFAARETVKAALAADFPRDALLGSGLSTLVSVVNSVIKRSGTIIEKALHEALEAGGKVVFRAVAMPVTLAAENIVASNPVAKLKDLRVRADADAKRTTVVDLLVIDPLRQKAMIYELKRGNGVTETRKRVPIEANLRCCAVDFHPEVSRVGA
jgi:hypothetical protein